jgi:hypothetical protein
MPVRVVKRWVSLRSTHPTFHYHERVNRAVRPHLDDNATKLWLDEATAAMLPI